MYLLFIIGLIGVFYELYNSIKLNNKRNDANEIIGSYKHKTNTGSFYIPLLLSLVFYMCPILNKKFVFAFWLSPLIVLNFLKCYKNSRKVELFDTGIQMSGYFVEWRRIKKLEYIEDKILIVTDDKKPVHYAVEKIEETEKCYIEMVKLTPRLNCI